MPVRGFTENDDAQFQIRGDDGELVDLIAGVPSNSRPSYSMLIIRFQLGTAFLRNVYMLNNYGDFIDGDVRTVNKPYIQLLSTVDTSKMYDEFYAARKTQTSSPNTVTALTSTIASVISVEPVNTFASIPAAAASSTLDANPTPDAGPIAVLGTPVLAPSYKTTNGAIPLARRGSLMATMFALLVLR
jgi:hypothetical protein